MEKSKFCVDKAFFLNGKYTFQAKQWIEMKYIASPAQLIMKWFAYFKHSHISMLKLTKLQ